MREKENSGIRRAPGAGAVDAVDFASPIEGGVAAGATRAGNAGGFRNGNAQSPCGHAAAGGFDGSTD